MSEQEETKLELKPIEVDSELTEKTDVLMKAVALAETIVFGRPDAPTSQVVYLAGPMRGKPDENKAEFYSYQGRLEEAGYIVINPHQICEALELRAGKKLDVAQYLRADIGVLLQCDCIALMPGWTQSEGAYFESYVCSHTGIPRHEVEDLLKAERSA